MGHFKNRETRLVVSVEDSVGDSARVSAKRSVEFQGWVQLGFSEASELDSVSASVTIQKGFRLSASVKFQYLIQSEIQSEIQYFSSSMVLNI